MSGDRQALDALEVTTEVSRGGVQRSADRVLNLGFLGPSVATESGNGTAGRRTSEVQRRAPQRGAVATVSGAVATVAGAGGIALTRRSFRRRQPRQESSVVTVTPEFIARIRDDPERVTSQIRMMPDDNRRLLLAILRECNVVPWSENSVSEIALLTGMDEQTVRRTLAFLEVKGPLMFVEWLDHDRLRTTWMFARPST